jgi:serine/threonine-protein kinase
LWSKGYDREKAEVFDVQDDIAGAIARSLQLRFYHGSTVSIPAFEAYLKARHYLWKLTPESLAQSREHYERAIALDSDFALAHCGYADYFLARAILGMVPAEEALPAARANARKALELDPFLPDAHAVLGAVATLLDLDWHEAERRFDMASAREAMSSSVRVLHAFYYLLPRNRTDEAVKELEQGLRDDPLNATLHRVLGVCLFNVGSYSDASRKFHEALELDEHSIPTMAMLAMDYAARGLHAEALTWAEQAHSLMPWDVLPVGLYAGLLMRSGDLARARKVLEKLGQSYGASFALALFHLLAGEAAEAVNWVQKSIEQRQLAGVFQLMFSPLGNDLRSSDRWLSLAKMLNLPDTTTASQTPTDG